MDLVAELAAIEAEFTKRRFRVDPNAWAKARLGDTLWTGQQKINAALATHRRVNVMSCHEIGKSYDAALLVGWWLDSHTPGDAFVVTSAPTGSQVRAILWREIGRVHARGGLPGRVNQTEWLMRVGTRDELVGFGRKPDEYDPAAFQGIHAPYVLVIFDEANGIRGNLWEAADSLIANDNSKMLAIGNPDDPSGEFFENCKPNSSWHSISISAFDSPNFTGEEMPKRVLDQLIGKTYVEEKRKKWAPTWSWGQECPSCGGENSAICEMCLGQGRIALNRCFPPPDGKLEDTHPFWQSKILGQFPVQNSTGSLIPLTWIRAAQERRLPAGEPIELSLDVGASEGGDPSCCGWRRGRVFRILYEERQPDTMKTTGKLIQTLQDSRYGAALAKVDYIGVGRGVVDRGKELELPIHPIQVNQKSTVLGCLACHHEWDKTIVTFDKYCPKCGSRALREVFANMLSQIWWSIRTIFEEGAIDIAPEHEDPELAEQLLTIRWEPNSKGQTVVKYGDGPSPNRADSLLIAYAPLPPEQEDAFVSW